MATTPTLGLTQYAGTDFINFLTQYNADMFKIDDSAKTSRAIGSDYIYSYTTPPSYSGGTVTVYSGTKYVCADGRDTNGDIKQTITTLSTNKTTSLSGTFDYASFIDNVGSFINAYTSNINMVNFVSELPSTVVGSGLYITYVVNEHRYYQTSGSPTANWQPKIYCRVSYIRVTSSAITYFKPNLQLNLAQKIGKDKLLMTMEDVQANTDKEFVPSAVAVKSMYNELGVDYIVEKGSNANGNYEKWHSGKLVMWGVSPATVSLTSPDGSQFYGTYSKTLPIASVTPVSATITIGCANAITPTLNGNLTHTSALNMYLLANVSLPSASINIHWHAIGTYIVG